MAVGDWSTTAGSNTTVGGINIGEGCPPGNINGAIREMMAEIRVWYGTIPDYSLLMPKSGGAFSGSITRSGAGAYRYNNDSSLPDGRTYFLAEGSARPSSPGEGVVVWYYAP